MQLTDFHLDGASTTIDVACGNGSEEILFGDVRWIAERLHALGTQGEAVPRQEGD